MNYFSFFFLATSCLAVFCPLCPVIIGAAVQGGFIADNPVLATSIAATATFPFLLAFVDGFRTRNMTFDFPKPGSVYHAGQTYSMFMETFGLSSRFHLRTSDLYLLNVSFDRVAKIGSEREFKVLHNLTRSKVGMPGKSIGHLDFTIPSETLSGFYYIKYVSGWTIWRHESKFQAISSYFVIAGVKDAECNTPKCVGLGHLPPVPEYSVETAPLELQFRYSHLKKAPQNLLNGLIDGAVAIPRAIVNPDKSSIKHPVAAIKNVSRDWDEEFDRNPFKATGQAVGAGLAVGVPAQLIMTKFSKKKAVVACNGGVCSLVPGAEPSAGQTHVFQVEGPQCIACTNAIKGNLEAHGTVKVSPVEGGNAFITLERTSLGADRIAALIEEMGFAARHVTSVI